jgi:hypothetical protein
MKRLLERIICRLRGHKWRRSEWTFIDGVGGEMTAAGFFCTCDRCGRRAVEKIDLLNGPTYVVLP